MQASTVTLSPESIVELAKNTIFPKQCEWLLGREQCPVQVGSWELLRKHYLRHSCIQRKQASGSTCNLPRCNVRSHTSPEVLQEHIKNAHMPRTLLPCPINGCRTSTNGHRLNQLSDHFLQEHSHLNKITINLPSDVLRPLWQPFSPLKTIPPPPSLPTEVNPGCIVIPSTKSATFHPEIHLSPSSTVSPRKQAQRQILKKDQAMIDSTDRDSMDLSLSDFEDIPSVEFPEDTLFEFQDLVVWHRPQVLAVDVSRPQPMRDSLFSEPPISMLYERFARYVDTLFPVT